MKGIARDTKIGIIGSGIAGLSAGLALHNAGFSQVTIYERDDCFDRRRQGYGLTMLQGNSALKTLGVYDKVRQIDTPSRSHYIFDCDGNIVGFFGTKFWPTPLGAPDKKSKYNLHVSRQNLRKILYEELTQKAPAIVEWNKKLESICPAFDTENSMGEGLWELSFSDGESKAVNLIIGCDGINSFVRRQVYPDDDNRLKYLGIMLVLGITQTEHYLSKERVFQTVDGNTRLFAMPFYGDENSSHENIMWQLSFPIDEEEARELAGNLNLLKARVLRICGSWHDPIPSLIQSTNLSLLMGIPAYDRDPEPLVLDSSQSRRSVVLLGDAAHPMSPFKGQGANQALLDGVNFADFLTRSVDVDEAVCKFETEMWNRVRRKVLDSRERATTFHQPDIVGGEFFLYRGVGPKFLQKLKQKGVNSKSGDDIDDLIISELNLPPNGHTCNGDR